MNENDNLSRLSREERRAVRKRRRQNKQRKVWLVITSVLLVIALITAVFLWRFVSQREKAASQMQAAPTPTSSEAAESSAQPEELLGEPKSEPEPEPEPEPQTITIRMVGDMLLHTPLLESGLMEDGSRSYDHFFTHTKDLIQEADLAIVNQEVILGGEELGLSGYPNFNAPFEVGDAMADAGFDVVLHATNHAVDKGQKAVENCLNFWRQKHPDMAALGIHDSQEDWENNVYYCQRQGITIAILNYTYDTNGIDLPYAYSVDMLRQERVEADLKEAREKADFVIAAPHWGVEYTHEIGEEEAYWANIFLKNGVDLVLGTHPHVIQPVKWLEGEDGHKMLVYYSLGNYINFTSDSGDGVRQRAVGAMADVTLTVEDGAVSITDYAAIPLVAHMVSGTGNPTVYPLSEYTEALAEENEMSRKDAGFTLEYCRTLCDKVFDKKWN